MSAMSCRQMLTALATAIVVLAALATTGTPVSRGSRTQHARVANGSPEIVTARMRSAPARRDRAPVCTHSLAAKEATELAAPHRILFDLETVELAVEAPAVHVVHSRSRAPPVA